MRFQTRLLLAAVSSLPLFLAAAPAQADENFFGYVRGAETIPEGAWELYNFVTVRTDKGTGEYTAVDTRTEIEYGLSDRFNIAGAFFTQSIDTQGIFIDAYIPGEEKYTLNPSGFEIAAKYNFLAPAIDPIGLATYFSVTYLSKDPHSGQRKDTTSAELEFLLQKYFLEGQLIWVGNAALETTYADRAEIENLPPGFEWPTEPEMEIELKFGTGLTYRFAPRWFLGAEIVYETEYETEVGQERWSVFAGPTLHYGAERWWATLTWFPQLTGGGEAYDGQPDNLHLIEKTKQEFRFKLGFNF